ncbi:hypothetical protein [Actinomadura sp. DC4]|uniref:hypothetical protein n=1 Tax=Actinomadura sp. DC4 TaxID=3055069 RepID=UPI0025AFBE87|nr:hypothetical protein [Actinomadura sp. DC4]MDN3354075.1 hypothetical protein [Actinomadura sp. DC4]
MNYSLEARLRVALSAKSAQAGSVATSLVPTHGEYGCPPGELTDLAGHLADTAAEALTLAIACERERGTSWEQIAEVLGESPAAARERYEEPVARLQRRLVEAWLDPDQAEDLPEGAENPGEAASRLDEWLTGEARYDDAYRHHPDSEVRAHPVSAGLAVMSVTEHRELLASAARLVAEENGDRRSAIGLHKRRIALLEWLLAEELNDPRGTGDIDEDSLRTLLSAARRQLAGL